MSRKEITRNEIERMIRRGAGKSGSTNTVSNQTVSDELTVGGSVTIAGVSGVLRANQDGLVFGSSTTSNLPEGTNLYYTDERVDDRVSSLIQNGTGLTWTYDDGAGTLTGNVDVIAAEVPYTNTTSGLTATDTQAALDEIEGRVDTLESAGGSLTHPQVLTRAWFNL